MKHSFLFVLLLALVGMTGNLTASAQTPEPSGQWTFDNPSDLLASAVGSMQMTPAVVGSASVTDATLGEAGIVAADGTTADDGAIFVPKNSALKVTRADGASASMSFSFMMDLKVPDAYTYDGLFQTSGSNANDGELFISKGQIGIGALGGYYGRIWNDTWYRIVFTMSNGAAKVYVNGKKVIEYETTNTRYEVDPYFYLLSDDDGEMSDTYLSEVAFWETPLTDEQVAAMEVPEPEPWIKSVDEINEGDQFYIISDRAKFNGSTTANPKGMACAQSNFPTNWGDSYVYWADLDKDCDGFVWTAEKVGDQWAFLNKENGKYIGNMNTGENDVIFSTEPVGYTLTDLAEGEGNFYMTNDESEHSLHVQGYLRNDRGSNSLAKQEVGDDNYETAESPRNGYPGRWHFVKINSAPVETGMRIETLDEFLAFAEAVNGGETAIDAYLAADIDLTGNDIMVGTSTNQYAGTFDGKGFKITYSYPAVSFNYGGLFSYVNNATIKNLYVEGSAVVQGIHFGALIGQANGTVLVEKVVTNVDITGDRSGVTGDGGMLGANYANTTFNYCATLGKMGNPGSSMYSPYAGWANGSSNTILNNCYTTVEFKEGTGIDDNSATLSHAGGPVTFNNCYYVNFINKEQGTPLDATTLPTGEFCFMMNGDQSDIVWYQTLGEDEVPLPFDSHLQVYANGELSCDGTSVGGGELTYSNTATSEVPPHTFEGGFCSVCGTWDPDYELETGSEGFRLIASAKDLAWFAEYLERGNQSFNAKLAADIDLTTSDYPDLMIAGEANRFSAIFDGDFHTITYNYANVTDMWRGLFRSVENATIRNLYVKATVVSTNIHYGALIGVAYGDVLVENVLTDVDITGKSSKGVQGDAGFLGANYANITFNNCATVGKMGYSGSSMYSPFSGWSNGSSSTTLNNCYSLLELKEGTGTGNCFTLTHKSGTVTINNSYYLNLIGTYVGGTEVTAEQVANGELCAKLGNGWYQNIGEDAYPIFDKTHNVVKEITEAGYATMYIPVAVSVPEGVEAFTGTIEIQGWLTLNPIGATIPAWEPVILKGVAGIYSFTPAADADNIADNVLKGASEDIQANGQYILAQPEGEDVGFYKATTGTIKAGKAYLESASGVKAFYFAGDEATGIAEVENAVENRVIYNLAGQRLQKMQKGINIMNGKKVLVK